MKVVYDSRRAGRVQKNSPQRHEVRTKDHGGNRRVSDTEEEVEDGTVFDACLLSSCPKSLFCFFVSLRRTSCLCGELFDRRPLKLPFPQTAAVGISPAKSPGFHRPNGQRA